MMARPYKEIFWVASPLAIEPRRYLTEKFGNYLPANLRESLDPAAKPRFFYSTTHWIIQVDDWCYELHLVAKEAMDLSRVYTDACEPYCTPASIWYKPRQEHGVYLDKRKVGLTRMTHEEIKAKMKHIWEKFNRGYYLLLMQNCQNFVRILYDEIAVSANDPNLWPMEKFSWQPIPRPLSYSLADFSHQVIADAVGAGAIHWILAPLAPVAQVAGYKTIGAMGITTGSSVGATTAVAGHGVGTAHLASTTHSAVGLGTGKVGIGAKLAGVSHAHGLGAVKLAAAAKAGVHFAMVHPVVAAGIVVLGALAFGKRDQGWSERHKTEALRELREQEVSVFDVAEAQDVFISRAGWFNGYSGMATPWPNGW